MANTQVLSSRLQFTLKDLGYEFPKYPVPDGESQMSFLRQRTYEGMLFGMDAALHLVVKWAKWRERRSAVCASRSSANWR